MQTKELIRNRILHNAQLIWGSKNIDRMDPIVRLMVEELSNELHLIQTNLNDIEALLLGKLAQQLTPDTQVAIRPAHAIMQITPTRPIFDLDRREPFYLKDIPLSFQKQGISAVTFCPASDVQLVNAKITHFFHDQTLWSVNNLGEKNVLGSAQQKAKYNTVWLALEVHEKVSDLKGLYFYFDFPNKDENHKYYDLLAYTQWTVSGKNLPVRQGLPKWSTEPLNEFDENILRFYHNRYLHIRNSAQVHVIPQEKIPQEIADYIGQEITSGLDPRCWLKITFPENFDPEDLDKMQVALNAIPVSNKRRYLRKINKNDLASGVAALPAGNGELFLDIDFVKDSNNQAYHCVSAENIKNTGTYHVKATASNTQSEYATFEYLERLHDIIVEERLEFPAINAEKVEEVIQTLAGMYANVSKKSEGNEKFVDQNIAKIIVNPDENIHAVNAYFWATNGMSVNGIEKANVLMAHKDSPLKKDNTVLLTDVCGGKEFSTTTDLMAINKYVLTSGNKVLTEENIVDFCKSELGKMVEKIAVNKETKKSYKPKEGLISVINIHLTPSTDYPGLLTQKGLLRDLKTRLQKRSPDHFNYRIKVMGNEQLTMDN